MQKTNTLRSCVLIALAVLLAVLSIELWSTRRDLHDAESRLEEDGKHQRQLVGSTRLWAGSNGEMLSYNLRSFDDGETWVVVQYDDQWRMKIKGDAEQLYPGLVKVIQGSDALTDRVLHGGPLDWANKGDRQLLKDAGFELVRK